MPVTVGIVAGQHSNLPNKQVGGGPKEIGGLIKGALFYIFLYKDAKATQKPNKRWGGGQGVKIKCRGSIFQRVSDRAGVRFFGR